MQISSNTPSVVLHGDIRIDRRYKLAVLNCTWSKVIINIHLFRQEHC